MARIVFALVALLAATAAAADEPPYSKMRLLAHRGVHQRYDRVGLTMQSCTANRMLPPKHAWLENTLESIRAAFEFGADRVEIDIHPTTDGEFVVFHDWTLDCRTDGTGVTREQTLAYLKSLDIGHGYTADGGRTYPFRGKFKGAMPSWAEVMASFPGKRILVNIKSKSAAEGRAAVAYARAHGFDLAAVAFSGDEAPMAAARQAWPGVRTISRARLKSCFIRYGLLGWSGHVPDACRDSIIYLPLNFTWLAWGWPNRFVERMASANSEVFVVGPYHSDADPAADLEIEDHRVLPPDYAGGIVTDRIEILGPVLRARPATRAAERLEDAAWRPRPRGPRRPAIRHRRSTIPRNDGRGSRSLMDFVNAIRGGAMLQNCPMYAYIPARDVARARRFYEEKVGLKPKQQIAEGVVYEFADHTACFLYDAGNSAGTNKASQAFWKVDDVEREVAALKARGVQFEHYESDEIGGMTMNGDIAEAEGGGKAAWFKDTEGNIMALIEERL